MKVVIATPWPYPGASAVAKHVRLVARGLLSAGVREVTVLAATDPRRPRALRGTDDTGFSFESLPTRALPRCIPSYLWLMWHYRQTLVPRLSELIDAKRCDAVVFYCRSWLVAASTWPLLSRHRVVVVPYPVEWQPPTAQSVMNGLYPDEMLFLNRLLPRATGLIAISRFWQEYGEKLGLPTMTIPSYADTDVELPQASCRASNEPFRVVFVGRWTHREMPQTLFSGLLGATQRGVDVRLIVIGNTGRSRAEHPALRLFEKSHELKARTHFTGFVDEVQLRSHLASAHAFVLLREECRETRALFPTRLPEYLLTSNPVICSTAGDLPCYLTHRKSAWLIPPGDEPGALADAIAHLASNEPERQAIGRGGREVAVEHMSYRVLGRRMETFLTMLIRQFGHAAGHQKESAWGTTGHAE